MQFKDIPIGSRFKCEGLIYTRIKPTYMTQWSDTFNEYMDTVKNCMSENGEFLLCGLDAEVENYNN